MKDPLIGLVLGAPHGTIGGYTNHGCRCPLCRRVNADYAKAERYARAKMVEIIPHGTEYGYCQWNCRCRDCREAHRTYARSQYKEKRSKDGLTVRPYKKRTKVGS